MILFLLTFYFIFEAIPAIRFNLSLRGTKKSHQDFSIAITGFSLLSGLGHSYIILIFYNLFYFFLLYYLVFPLIHPDKKIPIRCFYRDL